MGADGSTAWTRVDGRNRSCCPIGSRNPCVGARARLRPATANERLSILEDGSIAWLCKDPTRGKTHGVMQPMQLMTRLAASIPPRTPRPWT